MKRLKTTAVLLAAALLPLLLSGCWDYREVESLTLVDGVAVDRGQNGYQYHVTLECMRMAGDEKAAAVESWAVETDGNTVFEAVRSALKLSEKRLYFNPSRIIVLSEDIAKDGIRKVLDWFIRDAEPRITQEIVISREKTASEILKQKQPSGQLNSFLISSLLSGSSEFLGGTVKSRLYEVVNTLNSEGTSLTLPGVAAAKNMGDPNLELSGTAVFKNDRLTGWLSSGQTLYLNFIKNQISKGLFVTSDGAEDEKMSIEIFSSSTKIKPVVENGSVTMKISVDLSGALGERESEKELPGDETIAKVEEAAEKTLKKGIESLISRVQRENGSDIFGFGGAVYREDPQSWKKLKPEWDGKFKSLKCETEVRVKILNTALVYTRDGE